MYDELIGLTQGLIANGQGSLIKGQDQGLGGIIGQGGIADLGGIAAQGGIAGQDKELEEIIIRQDKEFEERIRQGRIAAQGGITGQDKELGEITGKLRNRTQIKYDHENIHTIDYSRDFYNELVSWKSRWLKARG